MRRVTGLYRSRSRKEKKLDYALITSQIVFDIDEIVELLEENLDEYVLMEHYIEEQLIESCVLLLEDIEIDYDPDTAGRFFKNRLLNGLLNEEAVDQEFTCLLKNNFATGILINSALLEIEIQDGRIVCLIGNRGELILRTGIESYVISPLFALSFQPDRVDILFNAIVTVLKKNKDKVKTNEASQESFSMVSSVCLMAMAKINELVINNYEIYLSHDEMLLFGLALNLAGEEADKDTQAATRAIMEQIKIYFPEIEHISPESFEPSQKMGKLLEFKKQGHKDEEG
jgi:L-rhamnose mutarotase